MLHGDSVVDVVTRSIALNGFTSPQTLSVLTMQHMPVLQSRPQCQPLADFFLQNTPPFHSMFLICRVLQQQ